jgi:hypothetical protein
MAAITAARPWPTTARPGARRHVGPLAVITAAPPRLPGAACHDPWVNPDVFFPVTLADAAEARATCARCPARVQCLRGARERGEEHGIWGGENFGPALYKPEGEPRP